jgi:hypothetical protein
MSKLLILSTVIATSSAAWAQGVADPEMQGPPVKSPSRQGGTVTLSVGPGEYHIIPGTGSEQRVEGPAFSLRGGSAFSQTAAIEAVISFVGGNGTKSLLLGGDLKFYAKDDVYIRAGAGAATMELGGGMSGMTERFWGPGVLASVGYEWFQLRDLALFGEFEAVAWKPGKKTIMGSSVDPDATVLNFQVNFGITWY